MCGGSARLGVREVSGTDRANSTAVGKC
jgi:hypothetical protein